MLHNNNNNNNNCVRRLANKMIIVAESMNIYPYQMYVENTTSYSAQPLLWGQI